MDREIKAIFLRGFQFMHRNKFQFVAGVYLSLERAPGKGPFVMATNGQKLLYNPEAINQLKSRLSEADFKKHMNLTVLEETLHAALLHPQRKHRILKRDGEIYDLAANLAADMAVLQVIRKAKIDWQDEYFLTIDAIASQYGIDYMSMPFEKIYEELKKKMPKLYASSQNGKNNNEDSDQDGKNNSNNGNQDGDKSGGSGDQDGNNDSSNGDNDKSIAGSIRHDVISNDKNALVAGEKKVRTALAQKTVGIESSELAEVVTIMEQPRQKISDRVRQFFDVRTRSHYSYKKPNPYVSQVILPVLYSRRVGKIVFVLDTSGSMGEHEFALFLGSVHKVLNELDPEEIVIIMNDAEVKGEFSVVSSEDLKEVRVLGRGGTDFSGVWDYIRKNHPNTQFVLFVTDLMTSGFGDPKGIDVLWLDTYGQASDPPFGERIIIGSYDLA